ncbi:hypothetical protein ABZ916_34365 [Streptomyces sp. NPDC046853]|uniref:hypothetical protein n=1 Tax=Streptomyces sp. NPDC046853 TaxID=3154920 RepID=UPI0033F48E63
MQTAERWITDRNDQWAGDSAFSFAVVDGGDVVLGNVSVDAVNRRVRDLVQQRQE